VCLGVCRCGCVDTENTIRWLPEGCVCVCVCGEAYKGEGAVSWSCSWLSCQVQWQPSIKYSLWLQGCAGVRHLYSSPAWSASSVVRSGLPDAAQACNCASTPTQSVSQLP
jgi:hypothetical protein